MTTIVYDHVNRQIALDGRSVSAGVVMNDFCEKFIWKDDICYFFSGILADIPHFMSLMGVKGKPEFFNNNMCIKVIESEAYICGIDDEEGYWEQLLTNNDGIGSGRFFALSALDFRATAEAAVIYAISRDIYSGGFVSVFDLKTMSFKES